MKVLVNYDVSDKHPEVKKRMQARGYRDTVVADNKVVCNLPNTTLYKDTEVAIALEDIKAVAAGLNVRLERAIACECTPWHAISGDKHAG